jgi:hypothetical protein
MNRHAQIHSLRSLRSVCQGLSLALTMLAAAAAHAGTVEIGDDINARLARAKSQQASEIAARIKAGDTSVKTNGGIAALATGGKGCNIAIGNVFEDKAISTSAKRETTVIVTGDVIQVGNNCR